MTGKNKRLARLLLFFLTGSTLSSCVDNDYDLSKDVDLTMGLGSENLTLKLGDTEKIYLRDVLEVDDSEMLDTLKTSQSLYYLVKEGNTEIKVLVDKIPLFTIDDVNLSPENPLVLPSDFGAGGDATVPSGALPVKLFGANSLMEVHITDIHTDIVRIRSLIPKTFSANIKLEIVQPEGTSFVIRSIKNMKITFPDAIHSSDFGSGTHVLRIEDKENLNTPSIDLSSFLLDSLVLGGSNPFGEAINDGRIDYAQNVYVEGQIVLAATESFTLRENESASIIVRVEMGDVEAEEVTGIVDPEIAPEFEPLEIGESLPDFLKDESVVLEMSNPTIKYNIHGEDLPIPILFSSELHSIKNGATISSVRLPVAEFVEISKLQNSLFYFYTETTPFDPNGVAGTALTFRVPELPNLVRRLPDMIDADFSDKKITANPAELHRIRLDNTYFSHVDYQLLIPFRFNRNLRILYTDSITEMNKDLKDYEADGVTLTATVENTIPLDLTLALIPLGVDGADLSDLIEVETATIRAATGTSSADMTVTPVSLTLKAHDRSSVSLIDQFEIKVTGVSVESSELYSSQYLILKDLRLKLNGQVVGNFN